MTHSHEPLIHIAKRDGLVWWKGWLIRLISLLLALIVSALFIYSLTKLNPVKVYGAMWQGAFGTSKRTWVTIRDMMMLLCIGVGLAPAFAMRFWNIGAEGQILMGGCATAAVMIYGGASMPTWLLIVLSFIVSLIAGAIWGLLPAIFKARWNTNETLFTLMMNYVATQLVAFYIAYRFPKGTGTMGIINQSTRAGWLPRIGGNDYILKDVYSDRGGENAVDSETTYDTLINEYVSLETEKEKLEVAQASIRFFSKSLNVTSKIKQCRFYSICL